VTTKTHLADPQGLRRETSLTQRLERVWPAAAIEGDQLSVEATIMRGGTSRGVFFRAENLPDDPTLRDRVVLAVFGSPDARQIDGLGGATPLTSKLAIVARAAQPTVDVDYLFGQVRIDEPRVDYTGNCGNMLSAVGAFAVDEGLVCATTPSTLVRIHVANSGQIVTAHVPTIGRRAQALGLLTIAGVPGGGAPVAIDFAGLSGTLGRGLLPTGLPREILEYEASSHVVSIVDAGNPTVFVSAHEVLGANAMMDRPIDDVTIALLDGIRGAAAERLGLVERASEAKRESPTIPKVYLVDGPTSYIAADGALITASDVSVIARGLSMGVPHPAIASTVAVCTAAAALIDGTVVAEANARKESSEVRIGHPSGVIEVDAEVVRTGEPRLRRACIYRTARRIMSGRVSVPMSVLGA
jgi:2-methylaconitate cis-trans-isomerase PrpF